MKFEATSQQRTGQCTRSGRTPDALVPLFAAPEYRVSTPYFAPCGSAPGGSVQVAKFEVNESALVPPSHVMRSGVPVEVVNEKVRVPVGSTANLGTVTDAVI